MFAQLLASRPVRQRSAKEIAVSVGLHVLVFGTAVYTTLGAKPVKDPPAQQRAIYVPPAVDRPKQVVAPPHAPPRTVPSAPPSGPVVSVPIEVPTTLPVAPPSLPNAPGDLSPSLPLGPGSAPTSPTVDPGSPYLATQVDEEVALVRGTPMPKFPNALRVAGVEGEARFRFVVDTLGRVEMSSVEQVVSTRAEFSLAVRQTLPRMRFRPARVDGRPVRQLVEFPIAFRLTR